MNTQPEALRIARELDDHNANLDRRARKELRRLHALNQELLEQCQIAEQIYAHLKMWQPLDRLRAAIAKAEAA